MPAPGILGGDVAGERRIDSQGLRRLRNGDLDALIDSFSVDAEQIVAVLGQTHRGRVEIRGPSRSTSRSSTLTTPSRSSSSRREPSRRSSPVAWSPPAHRDHRRDDPDGDGARLRSTRWADRLELHLRGQGRSDPSGQIARISRPEDGRRRSSKCCPLDSTQQKARSGRLRELRRHRGQDATGRLKPPTRRPQAGYWAGDVPGERGLCASQVRKFHRDG